MVSKFKSVWAAAEEIRFIERLRAEIAKLTDDDEAIRDTLEGELAAGQIDNIMNSLLHAYHEAKAVCEARKAYAAQIADAAKAADAQADKIKELIDQGMIAAQQRDWKGVMGSVYYTEGRLGVDITDESAVPTKFHKPAIDKTRLNEAALAVNDERVAIQADVLMSPKEKKAALDACPQIPGVAVVKRPDSLTIRKPSGKKGG